MPKGYKLPKSAAPRAAMRAGKPKEQGLLSPAPKMTTKIPEIRPTSLRNMSGWKGFKPGKLD